MSVLRIGTTPLVVLVVVAEDGTENVTPVVLVHVSVLLLGTTTPRTK
jgi:hypothetical protein